MSAPDFCDICQCRVPGAGWDSHVAGKGHCRKAGLRAQAVLESAQRDRNGVTVSTQDCALDFGVVNPRTVSQVVKTLTLTAAAESAELLVLDPQWTSRSLSVGAVTACVIPTLSHFSCELEGDPHLWGNRHVRVIVRLRATEIGRYEDTLEIRFVRVFNNERFSVTRTVKATVGDADDYALLRPTAPYVPRRRADRQGIGRTVAGVPPERLLAIAWRTRLGRYRIPKSYHPILSTPPNRPEPGVDIVPAKIRSLVPPILRRSSHSTMFSLLLWLEEIAMENALQVFDMESVRLSKHGLFHHLPVPGLAENRPSVIIGDAILVKPSGAAGDKWFQGHVHYVRESEVALRFHQSFPKNATQPFDVRFQLGRIPIRRLHQSICDKHYPPHLLFPQQSHVVVSTRSLSRLSITLYDRKIANNTRQLQAIKQILTLPSTSAPFIIFGPPGTGKTVTIVEAIKQILRRNSDAHVLACAPSNSAADVIALRLSELLKADELFRFYAPSRKKNRVPPGLLPYTFENRDGLFSHPPLGTVKKFRVIVCTCVSAAFTLGIGVERGHFSHVFIDEAGQATEPEAMVVVKNTAVVSTKLILSGDPKQLRPVVQSAIANELGLGVSYLERLMECDAYQGSYDGSNGIVKLLSNYRSHPAIIHFPSEQFYDGELDPCGEPSSINSCLNLEPLVRGKYPIIFCAVGGQDTREASSPSFFNPEEVLQVKSYVQQLLADRRAPAHIGIIAPYRAQCTKLRTTLTKIAPEIKIGSVEEFQGDERRVVIVTTVRSSRDYINYDLRYTLGFVANPRRFNVAVTRAKALLIIVGDPMVLGLDPLWRAYLNSVHAGGGWRGRQIPWDPLEPVNSDGGYDEDLRVRALGDADALARRLVDEADFGAGEDQPFREPEE
ncbi:P-loop containing nucleoside triphosphate hydrolase protein [Russula brevipes]|nr:P-loop containing nucleoside triphosphate hydrolase protein [Russula brevipes]